MGDPLLARVLSGLSFAFLLPSLLPFLLLALAIPYAVLRIQNSQSVERDTQIGLKCVLFFALSLGIFLVLTGLTILVIDLLVDQKHNTMGSYLSAFGGVMRTACALMMAGVMIAVFHLILISGFSNSSRWPETRRVFVGWRLAIHTVVFLSALTILNVQLFQEAPRWEDMKPTLGVLIVWLPSWLIHLVLLKTYRGQGRRPEVVPMVELS